MIHFRKPCFLMVFLLLGHAWGFSAAARNEQTEQTTTLEVIGRGRISRDNVAKARDEAIVDGLWNAVEQGVGLLLSPEAVVDHFQVLSDRVYPQAEEFIHDYKVLTESKSGKYYRVIVRVTLLTDMLKDKLQDIGMLMTDRELPSVLFLLSEQNVGETSARHPLGIGTWGDHQGAVGLGRGERITEGTRIGVEWDKPFVARALWVTELRYNHPVAPDDGQKACPKHVTLTGGKLPARAEKGIIGTDSFFSCCDDWEG